MCEYVGDYKLLKKELIKLYNKYLQSDNVKSITIDQEKLSIEQREYLETCVTTLKDKFENNIKVNKQDTKRMMKEKVDLINAINELKREIHEKEISNKKNEELKIEVNKYNDLEKKFSKNKKIIKGLRVKLNNNI